MLTNDELMAEWESDCKIDPTQLMHTMRNFPQLHAKYLNHLQTYKHSLRKHVLRYAKLKSVKIRYYSGEMTKDQLDERGWTQYLFKRPLKSELESLLEGDSDLQLIQEQSVHLESLVVAVESIMKNLSNMYFLFTNLVAYEKFQSGG